MILLKRISHESYEICRKDPHGCHKYWNYRKLNCREKEFRNFAMIEWRIQMNSPRTIGIFEQDTMNWNTLITFGYTVVADYLFQQSFSSSSSLLCHWYISFPNDFSMLNSNLSFDYKKNLKFIIHHIFGME